MYHRMGIGIYTSVDFPNSSGGGSWDRVESLIYNGRDTSILREVGLKKEPK